MGASAKEKAERDTRLVDEFSDDLTVAIALRKWDRAVTLVEEGKLVPDDTSDENDLIAQYRRSETCDYPGHRG